MTLLGPISLFKNYVLQSSGYNIYFNEKKASVKKKSLLKIFLLVYSITLIFLSRYLRVGRKKVRSMASRNPDSKKQN
jgi:hypothetical protein